MLDNLILKEIDYITIIEHSKGTKINMENRQWYGISLALDGEIVYRIDGREYISDKENIIILPKNSSYELECKKNGRFILVNFLTENDIEINDFMQIKTSSPEKLCLLYSKLEKINMIPIAGKQARLFSAFYDMLAFVIEEATHKRIMPILNKAVKYIKDNLSSPDLNNINIASHIGISEIYLRKLFNKNLLTSPKQFIQSMRIEYAKILLTSTSCSVSTISEKCGYTNVYTFCRFFKSKTAYTPTQFREKCKII